MGKSTDNNAEESRCKKHPKHRESTGVCPFCLRERLSHLSSSPSFSSSVTYPYPSSSAASSSPCPSDSDSDSDFEFSSLTASPVHPAAKRSRLALLLREDAGRNVEPLKKCRSLILVVGRGTEDEDDDGGAKGRENCGKKKKEKKRRFWSRFLSGPSVGREGGCSLTHSKSTIKERPATKWVLFS